MIYYELEFWKYLLGGFSILYLFLATHNYSLYKISVNSLSGKKELHGWRTCLALASGGFCLSELFPLVAPQVLPIEVTSSIIYLAGIIVSLSYAHTMKEYLYNGKRIVKRLTILFSFTGIFIFTIELIRYIFSPESEWIYKLKPYAQTDILGKYLMGDYIFIPTPLQGMISFFIIAGNIYLFYGMVRGWYAQIYKDKVIIVGVALSCIAFSYEVVASILSLKIILLIFISNFLEVIRTTAMANQEELTRLSYGKAIAEENLKIQKLQKDKVNREALHSLAVGVAHEINNPLFIILASINKLKTHQGILNQTQKEKIHERVNSSASRIKSIVNSLSELGDRNTEEFATITNIELIETIKTISEFQLDNNKEIDFILNTPEEGISLLCNQQDVLLGIFELMKNAICAVKDSSIKVISLKTSITEDFLCFNITDSGSGISDEIKSQVMNPFFSTIEGSMGMGLTTVHNIGVKHGGKITIKNIREGCVASLLISRYLSEKDYLVNRGYIKKY